MTLNVLQFILGDVVFL